MLSMLKTSTTRERRTVLRDCHVVAPTICHAVHCAAQERIGRWELVNSERHCVRWSFGVRWASSDAAVRWGVLYSEKYARETIGTPDALYLRRPEHSQKTIQATTSTMVLNGMHRSIGSTILGVAVSTSSRTCRLPALSGTISDMAESQTPRARICAGHTTSSYQAGGNHSIASQTWRPLQVGSRAFCGALEIQSWLADGVLWVVSRYQECDKAN